MAKGSPVFESSHKARSDHYFFQARHPLGSLPPGSMYLQITTQSVYLVAELHRRQENREMEPPPSAITLRQLRRSFCPRPPRNSNTNNSNC